jgi:hypothetical protein
MDYNNIQLNESVTINITDGILTFKIAGNLRNRIFQLLAKRKYSGLTVDEENEMTFYDKLNDYVTLVNSNNSSKFKEF